jgi:hypothetical protein
MAVQAAGRHIGKLAAELGRRERTVAEERLDDAEAHRVQEQIGGRHLAQSRSLLAILLTFTILRTFAELREVNATMSQAIAPHRGQARAVLVAPVRNHWSLVVPVREADLTRAERKRACAHRDVRIP